MFFKKLFSKKDIDKNDPKKENKEQTILMLNQKIREEELRLKKLEEKAYQLQEEAKKRLEEGDKEGTKQILSKKSECYQQIHQIEKDLDNMQEQKIKLENGLDFEDVNTDNKDIKGDKVEQKIQQQELALKKLETKANELQEEAKVKLKSGDKTGAKLTLDKRRKYVEQIKKINEDLDNMEEQKVISDSTLQLEDVNDDEIEKERDKVEKKIQESELRLKDLAKKAYELREEAKEKLKSGDKAGARLNLEKKNKYLELIKQIKGDISRMKEQKNMLDLEEFLQ